MTLFNPVIVAYNDVEHSQNCLAVSQPCHLNEKSPEAVRKPKVTAIGYKVLKVETPSINVT